MILSILTNNEGEAVAMAAGAYLIDQLQKEIIQEKLASSEKLLKAVCQMRRAVRCLTEVGKTIIFRTQDKKSMITSKKLENENKSTPSSVEQASLLISARRVAFSKSSVKEQINETRRSL
jgi:hypothetical protein